VIGPQGDKWAPLSRHLGPDQPFYCLSHVRAALTPYDLQAGDRYDDVVAVAKTYATSIRQWLTSGSVVLAGYCQGGLFAYEVAQRLHNDGIEVELVLMVMDSHAPLRERRDTWARLAQAGRANRQQSLMRYVIGAIGRANEIRKKYVVPRVRRRLELVRVQLADRFAIFDSEAAATRRNAEAVFADLEAYEYSPYDGTVGVIRGLDDPLTAGHTSDGWGDLTKDLKARWLPVVSTERPQRPCRSGLVRSETHEAHRWRLWLHDRWAVAKLGGLSAGTYPQRAGTVGLGQRCCGRS